MSSSLRRADGSIGRIQLVLRLALALAVALLSVPFLTGPAEADGETPAPTDTSTPAPAPEDPGPEPAPAPAADPPADQPADQPAAEAPAPEPASAPAATTSGTTTSGKTAKSSTSATTTVVESGSGTGACGPNTGDGTVTGFNQNTKEDRTGSWINGALNQNNSNYAEGDYVPQRVQLSGLNPGAHQIYFTYDRTKNGKFAYDFVDHLSIDEPGATISWDAAAPNPPMPSATSVTVKISWTMPAGTDGVANIIWDGHISSELDYNPGGTAGYINGAPYHFSLGDLNCASVGNMDNQLMADAVDAGFLTVVKDAQPNDPQDFSFLVEAPNDLSDRFLLDDDPDSASPLNTRTYRVPPGSSTVSETAIPGGWALTDLTCKNTDTGATVGSRTGNAATVSLVDDSHITCTFTNSRAASVTVDKVWKINGQSYGEGAAQAAFPQLGLTAALSLTGPAPAGASSQPWGVARTGYLQGGTTTISEAAGSGNALCGPISKKVTLANGAAVDAALPYSPTLQGGANSYTVTNSVQCAAQVTLVKVVDNGPAVPGAWTLSATRGDAGNLQGPSGASGTPAATGTITAGGTYSLGEAGGDNRYVQKGDWSCTDGVTVSNGTIQVGAGRSTTCTVHNATAKVTLVKKVVNDDGGSATAADWTLQAGSGSGASGSSYWVTPGQPLALSESGGPAGYTRTSIVCSDDPGHAVTSVTPTAGSDVTCTFTNDDDPATLSLNKIVDNGSTGAGTDASAFTLTATPQPAIAGQDPVSGAGGFTATEVKSGTYLLGESGPAGYDQGTWSCSGGTMGGTPGAQTITLANGGSASCTITNTARQPILTLDKTVLGNEYTGGTAVDGDFELEASGPVLVHGFEGADGDDDVTGVPVKVGTYTLAELGGPAGYDQYGAWWCGEDHPVDAESRVVIGLGDNVTCTVKNKAQKPHLTLLKKVAGNEAAGGTAADTDWTLAATGPVSISGVEGDASITGAGVKKGTYVLSESGGPAGYTQTAWHCWGGGTQGVDQQGNATITIALGEDVTCKVVNTAQQPHLTLGKTVDNGATGGTAVDTDWTLSATGPASISGVEGEASVTGAAVPAGTYVLSESGGVDGYERIGWQCTGGTLGTNGTGETTVTVVLGADVSCTVTNAAEQSRLTLGKSVDDNGTGVIEPDTAWTLLATGATYSISGVEGQSAVTGAAVPAGTYVLAEANGPAGWKQVGWECTGGTLGTDQQGRPTVTVALGAHVSCEVTNQAVPSTWAVTKTNDPGTGTTVAEGDVITYHVTATKTSDGVDVLDAVVTDDLSEILPDKGSFVAGSIVAPAGSSAELVGDHIVWTIDRLGDEPVTLDYQVLVGGLDGVTLRNHATGDGAEECLKGDPDCTTVNYTPHYVLDKAVEYDDPDGDGLAMPGQTLTYSLSLTNDTAHADVTDVVVHDDLTDVLDDADLAMTAEQLAAAGLELNTDDPAHPYLVWTVAGPVAPGAGVATTYTVTIHDDAWDATLHNVATPADEVGSCVATGECETTTDTPPVTTLVIKKVDFEDSSEDPTGLPGATFALYQDNAPYADPSDPVKGAEDTLVSEQVTGADGLAKWAELLQGHYLVHETVPPVNYDLPEQTWMVVVIDESNFVNGGEMAPILFRDFAQGQLTLTKRQWELEGTTWVDSDGEVNFGDVVKYTMHLETTGPKRFHDVKLTDWVPDNNPADVTSTGTASLVPDSAVCLDEFETVCSVTVGADGLITWDIGDLQTDSVDLEFVVQFPDLPDEVTYDENDEYRVLLWNQAYVAWREVVGAEPGTSGAYVYQDLTASSNEVVVQAVANKPGEPVEPPPPVSPPENPPANPPAEPVLPATGAPAHLAQLALLGGLALALGVALAARGRRKVAPRHAARVSPRHLAR